MFCSSEVNEQGILWYKSGNYEKAKMCWETSAKQGNSSAMFCLGILYLSTKFYDLQKSKSWFEKAALRGHKNAGYQLEHLNDGKIRTEMADKILFYQPSDESMVLDFESVKFGKYEWFILQKDIEKSLYLTKSIIDIRKYHDYDIPITWEKSDIRKWLNSEFYDEFSTQEKERICATNIVNSKNPKYFTIAGDDTLDKCFLLSYEDIMNYFTKVCVDYQMEDLLSGNVNNYRLTATVNMSDEKIYKAENRSGLDYSMANGQRIGWWLRTPGSNENRAMRINCNGAIRLHGREVNRNLVGIRPAIWVKNYE